MDPTSIRLAGVPDLGALARASKAPTSPPLPGVVDVTEETFGPEVIERSLTTPVIVDFWADWCGPCKQLSPILERLAGEAAGRWILAKIDVDSNQRIAQAAQVQGIPAVKAVVGGRVVAEFSGAIPEAQVRTWLEQVLALADQVLAEGADAGLLPEPVDPELLRADEALATGDLDGAASAFQDLLDRSPSNAEAASGLARVELIRRATSVDQEALQSKLSETPDDVVSLCSLADLLVLSERADEALSMLVDVVRRTTGDDRERARQHLLRLFSALGDDDPRVLPARRALASALY